MKLNKDKERLLNEYAKERANEVEDIDIDELIQLVKDGAYFYASLQRDEEKNNFDTPTPQSPYKGHEQRIKELEDHIKFIKEYMGLCIKDKI
jgi:hypothetical protein